MKPFVAYSEPNEIDYIFHEIASVTNSIESKGTDRFVFCPFDKVDQPAYSFELHEARVNANFNHNSKTLSTNLETSLHEYTAAFEQVVDRIENTNLEKTVLSRVILIADPIPNLSELYKQLVVEYSQAFVYIIYHDLIGTWIGVSPETIIRSTQDGFVTQAIAGTIQKDSSVSWTEKEKKEQLIILEHLRTEFEERNFEYQIGETTEIDAGKVKHIKTDITFRAGENLSELLEVLHPNPALSGYPIKESIALIKEIEFHDRKYYCGIVGIININKVSLFANIRCMECHENQYDLFVGGGIVRGSDLKNEWKETEMKATTLSRVINKRRESDVFQ